MEFAVEKAVEGNALVVEIVTVGEDLVGAASPLILDLKCFNKCGLTGAVFRLDGPGDGFEPVKVFGAELDDVIRQSGAEGRLRQFAPEGLELVVAAGGFSAEGLGGQAPGGLRLSEQRKLLVNPVNEVAIAVPELLASGHAAEAGGTRRVVGFHFLNKLVNECRGKLDRAVKVMAMRVVDAFCRCSSDDRNCY